MSQKTGASMDELRGDIVTQEWLDRHGTTVVWEKIGETYHRRVLNMGTADITIDPTTGRINSAKEADQSLLAWMVTRGILDETHSYYAMVFQDLRRYFRRCVDYRANTIYALEFFGGSNSGILETLYVRVCRIITPRQEQLIHRATEVKSTSLSRKMAWEDRGHYHSAFDALISAIDTVRKAEEENA
jgi:hypothetical protein